MQQILMCVFRVMPLLFGLGFLAPLLAQIIVRLGWTPPLGLSPVIIGLTVGGLWGGLATVRGRWF